MCRTVGRVYVGIVYAAYPEVDPLHGVVLRDDAEVVMLADPFRDRVSPAVVVDGALDRRRPPCSELGTCRYAGAVTEKGDTV